MPVLVSTHLLRLPLVPQFLSLPALGLGAAAPVGAGLLGGLGLGLDTTVHNVGATVGNLLTNVGVGLGANGHGLLGTGLLGNGLLGTGLLGTGLGLGAGIPAGAYVAPNVGVSTSASSGVNVGAGTGANVYTSGTSNVNVNAGTGASVVAGGSSNAGVSVGSGVNVGTSGTSNVGVSVGAGAKSPEETHTLTQHVTTTIASSPTVPLLYTEVRLDMFEGKLGFYLVWLLVTSVLGAPLEGWDDRRVVDETLDRSLHETALAKRIVVIGGHEGEVGGKTRAGPFIIEPLEEEDLPPPPTPETPVHSTKLKLGPAAYAGGIRLNRVGLAIPNSQPLPAVKSTPGGLVGLAAGTSIYSGKTVFNSDTLDDTISGLRLRVGTANRPTAFHPDAPEVGGGDEKKDPRNVVKALVF
ncbi:hypothetical protein ONZ45_g12464 [Pleurotus djamor]|nr:hypothetical protein ONZ45_g12464 [Pleurotus djamor]